MKQKKSLNLIIALMAIACLFLPGVSDLRADALIQNLTGGTDETPVDGLTIGFVFTVSGTSDLDVSSLGVYDPTGDGLSSDQEVGLWDEEGNLLGSVSITAGSGSEVNQFVYGSLATPVTLVAGDPYTVAVEYSSTNSVGYYDSYSAVNQFTFGSGIEVDAYAYRYSPGSGFPVNGTTSPDYLAIGPNLIYTEAPVDAIPEPSTASLVIMAAAGVSLLVWRRREYLR